MSRSNRILGAMILGACFILSLLGLLPRPAEVSSAVGLQDRREPPKSVPLRAKISPNRLHSPVLTAQNPARYKEDDDLADFIKQIMASPLTEEMVLGLLQSTLSPHKKAVLLSLYTRQGGAYLSARWQPLLLSLIKGSDPWPELANKASDGLAQGNVDGKWDFEILQTLDSIDKKTDADVIKRTALAYALHGKDALERAKAHAASEPEKTLLAQKYARLLTQDDRIEEYQSQADSALKTLYLESFLKNAQSAEEIAKGLDLGLSDPKILPIDQPALYLAASEASFVGHTDILLDHWKRLALRQKEGQDLTPNRLAAILSIALQKAAFSAPDPKAVLEIIETLKGEGSFAPGGRSELRITLALLMVQGCQDPLVKKHLCPELAEELQSLRNQLERDGLGKYLSF